MTVAPLGGSGSTFSPDLPPAVPAVDSAPHAPAFAPNPKTDKPVNPPGAAAAARLRAEARNSGKAVQHKPGWLNRTVYSDPSFTGKAISQFASEVLDTPEENLEDILYDSLPKNLQTETNRKYIRQSLNHSVNASGAVMMFVNTDEGLKLIAAHSQRRKTVIQSNGSCEKGESMKDTAMREFFEELGNPSPTGILGSILADESNFRSIVGTNKIGENAAEIAERMVKAEGKAKKLYLNASAIYANRKVVSSEALNAELMLLNDRLGTAAKFYNDAALFLYGDRAAGTEAADLNDTSTVIEAGKVITAFQNQCPDLITPNFKNVFSDFEKNPLDPIAVKTALHAIVDLSENSRLEAHDETSLKSSMSLFTSDKDAFKKTFFAPGFESIFAHQGQRSADEFFNELKNVE